MKMPANHSMKCILGIDLGGTSLRVARVDALGGAFLRIPTPGRAEAEATMVSAIRKIASGWEVHYTGLSRAPGIDAQGCVVDWPSRPEWNGLELIPWLLSAAGSAVDSADDGACAALWEHRSRVDTSKNAVTACVSIGTGLAVGIMAGDELIATGDGSDTLSHQQFGNLDARGNVVLASENECRCRNFRETFGRRRIEASTRVVMRERPERVVGGYALELRPGG